MTDSRTARLLIACPDARGIVAAVANFVSDHGGNLLDSDQHTDSEHDEFFMRAAFDLAGCDLDRGTFDAAWSPVAERFGMSWQVHWSEPVKRAAVLVGRQMHCLQDLVWRRQAGELAIDMPLIISNHATAATVARDADIAFHHCPIDGGDPSAQEDVVRGLLADANIDFVVLARYMRILSARFIAEWTNRIINIHHSFLPAFAGSDPYRQAYDRGVKVIGATSHYATQDLDQGPIIAQAVAPVSHRDGVADLRRKGRDLERIVLAQAVRSHVEDKILVSQNKTVVFD